MKKLALAMAFAVSTVSFAGINLIIDTQYMTVVRPGAGSVTATFTGTLDVLLPAFDVNFLNLEFPSDGTNFLTGGFAPAFSAYMGSVAPGVDYTGALFTITVASTDALGFYWLNGSGPSLLSEFTVQASDGTRTATDTEVYGVNVVPEPATLIALGAGVVALARKRRRA